jgi:hypothetical protein
VFDMHGGLPRADTKNAAPIEIEGRR